ncbi:hypothetical protein KsCSTR_20920 [Candidatus Kuenenia stuttgartiensis]|uniref:Uncharacterized protein n=1 Tax=Kuenenia stuttgartiensis TaxID=174633 RepID=A0A6G7GPV8_KUEST|nr:hypothetical protein KsCSTR_20920 [Candidatus Kuenenia stuttgartiensis]
MFLAWLYFYGTDIPETTPIFIHSYFFNFNKDLTGCACKKYCINWIFWA